MNSQLYKLGITSKSSFVYAASALIVGFILAGQTYFRSEGLAAIMLTVLAAYSIARIEICKTPSEKSLYDWILIALLVGVVALIWQAGLWGLDMDLVIRLVMLSLFTLGISLKVRGLASLKVFWMLALIFVLVPALEDLETVLSYPMRRLSSILVYLGLTSFDPNLMLRGTELSFSNMRINITEACDGLNLMQNLLWIIWLNGLLMRRDAVHQAICFLLKTPLVLVVNTLRIFSLTALVWWYGPEVLAGAIHVYSGWMAVILAAFIYLKIDVRLAGDNKPVMKSSEAMVTSSESLVNKIVKN